MSETVSTLCSRCGGLTFWMERGFAKMCPTCCLHKFGRSQVTGSFGVNVGKWSCLACGQIADTEKG